MQVEDVEVVRVEAVEGSLDLGLDVLLREGLLEPRYRGPEALRGDDVVLAVLVLEPLADPALGVAAAVAVGGVVRLRLTANQNA